MCTFYTWWRCGLSSVVGVYIIYLVEVWSLLSGRCVHYIPGGGVVSLEW